MHALPPWCRPALGIGMGDPLIYMYLGGYTFIKVPGPSVELRTTTFARSLMWRRKIKCNVGSFFVPWQRRIYGVDEVLTGEATTTQNIDNPVKSHILCTEAGTVICGGAPAVKMHELQVLNGPSQRETRALRSRRMPSLRCRADWLMGAKGWGEL